MSSLVIMINAVVRDVLEREEWFDPDGFGLRLSEAVAEKLRSGLSVSDAISSSVSTTATRLFLVNRGARRRLPRMLTDALGARGVTSSGPIDLLRRFRRFAERQLVSDLAKSKREDTCRSHLQTYLDSHGRSFREVSVGAGRTDLLLILADTEEVIETKVWRGPQNHEDGLEELRSYMAAEGLHRGYYVVFEFHKLDPVTPDEEQYGNGSVAIDVIFVHIPLTAPSQIAKARRRNSRRAR